MPVVNFVLKFDEMLMAQASGLPGMHLALWLLNAAAGQADAQAVHDPALGKRGDDCRGGTPTKGASGLPNVAR